VTVNLAESPLGWLKARGLISARQYDAGEMPRGDWSGPCSRPLSRCAGTRRRPTGPRAGRVVLTLALDRLADRYWLK